MDEIMGVFRWAQEIMDVVPDPEDKSRSEIDLPNMEKRRAHGTKPPPV
jgi:hypothetical protein